MTDEPVVTLAKIRAATERSDDPGTDMYSNIYRARHAARPSEWQPIETAPSCEPILAQIEFLIRGCVQQERIVVAIDVNGDLKSECGDDLGWSAEVITAWCRLPKYIKSKGEKGATRGQYDNTAFDQDKTEDSCGR